METVIVLGILSIVGYYVFRAGKRKGSKQGYGAGRARSHRRRS